MSSRPPLSSGPGIEIDRAVRLTDEGHVLVGGCPPRAVRLAPEQVSALIRWLSGSAPRGTEEGLLARALIRAGLAHPRPRPLAPDHTVEVAVVGRTGHHALTTTLDHLADHHPKARTVVVGATGAGAWAARRRGARVVLGPNGGAEAMTAALRACSADLVALVEAGTRPSAGWLDTALGHFDDPEVMAVVPRVLTDRSTGLGHARMTVAAIAASGTGADRGGDPAPVLPWGHSRPWQRRPGAAGGFTDPLRPVPALVVRRIVADLEPGWEEAPALDLLWRMVDQGWSVRYEPRSRVWVPPTTDVVDYLSDSFTAGALAAPLARRHGQRQAGPELPLAGVVGLALAVTGRPGAALVAGVLGGVSVAGELLSQERIPLPETARMAALDLVHTVRAGTHAVRTSWWPLAAAAAVGGAIARRRGRGSGENAKRAGRIAVVAGAALTLPHVMAWHRDRGTALTGPVTWTVLGMAGDAARSLGTWWGAVRARTPAPLLPRIRSVSDTTPSGGSGEGRGVPGRGPGRRLP